MFTDVVITVIFILAAAFILFEGESKIANWRK
jgi:hypothetical protein